MFDKRYLIFHKTWSILSETAASGASFRNYGLYTPFNNFLPEAAFLFGKDVERYLNDATTKWAELKALESERDGQGVNQQENIARASDLKQWFFHEASAGAKELFGRYLNFERWK